MSVAARARQVLEDMALVATSRLVRVEGKVFLKDFINEVEIFVTKVKVTQSGLEDATTKSSKYKYQ